VRARSSVLLLLLVLSSDSFEEKAPNKTVHAAKITIGMNFHMVDFFF
jgi:hypothetical protein